MTTSFDNCAIVLASTWAGVPELVGKEFRSAYFQIDSEHQELFERAAYLDLNAHELAPDFYDDGLIEGIHLLGVVDHLTNAVLVVDEPNWAGWNYGYDKVRFVSEVTTRDSIRVSGTVREVEPRGYERYLVTLGCAVEVAGRDKPGAVIEWRVLWARS